MLPVVEDLRGRQLGWGYEEADYCCPRAVVANNRC